MIADKILDIIFGIANVIIGLLPTYTPGHETVFTEFLSAISFINQIFPVDSLSEAIGAYMVFLALTLGIKPILKFARIS